MSIQLSPCRPACRLLSISATFPAADFHNPLTKSAEFDLLSKLISGDRIPLNFVSYLRKRVGFKRAISFAILWWVHEVTFLAGYRKGYERINQPGMKE